jgi:hypothetical protein
VAGVEPREPHWHQVKACLVPYSSRSEFMSSSKVLVRLRLFRRDELDRTRHRLSRTRSRLGGSPSAISPQTDLYVARAEVRFRLTRSRRRRRLQIGRHQRKRQRLRLRGKHTISHRARYNCRIVSHAFTRLTRKSPHAVPSNSQCWITAPISRDHRRTMPRIAPPLTSETSP